MLACSTKKQTRSPHRGHLRLMAWERQMRTSSEWTVWLLHSTRAPSGTEPEHTASRQCCSCPQSLFRWGEVMRRGVEWMFYDFLVELDSLWDCLCLYMRATLIQLSSVCRGLLRLGKVWGKRRKPALTHQGVTTGSILREWVSGKCLRLEPTLK